MKLASIKGSVEYLIKAGYKILGDGIPREGAHGKPVIFLHPATIYGTLIELEAV